MGPQDDNPSSQTAASSPSGIDSGRIEAFDTLRGIAVASMVAFHACYDLGYIYGADIPWFTSGPLQEIWRISISWVFLALAGWMTSLSKSNIRRAVIYGLTAFVIWIATAIASVDTPISFGIMYCMAASTLLWWALERLQGTLLNRYALISCGVFVALFLVAYNVPRIRYPIEGLAWLGFPGPTFSSSDYYPLIPYSFLYCASASLSRRWHRGDRAYPRWMYRDYAPILTWIGRHALFAYLTHQVLILLILNLIFG